MPGSPAPGAEEPAPEDFTPEDHAAQAQYHGESPDAGAAIDFPQFVLATARLAAMFLGDIPSPQSGRPELNLGAAKQQIDLLGMLQEKTRGNLQREEEQLVQALLTELRLRFVEIRQQVSKGGKRGG